MATTPNVSALDPVLLNEYQNLITNQTSVKEVWKKIKSNPVAYAKTVSVGNVVVDMKINAYLAEIAFDKFDQFASLDPLYAGILKKLAKGKIEILDKLDSNDLYQLSKCATKVGFAFWNVDLCLLFEEIGDLKDDSIDDSVLNEEYSCDTLEMNDYQPVSYWPGIVFTRSIIALENGTISDNKILQQFIAIISEEEMESFKRMANAKTPPLNYQVNDYKMLVNFISADKSLQESFIKEYFIEYFPKQLIDQVRELYQFFKESQQRFAENIVGNCHNIFNFQNFILKSQSRFFKKDVLNVLPVEFKTKFISNEDLFTLVMDLSDYCHPRDRLLFAISLFANGYLDVVKLFCDDIELVKVIALLEPALTSKEIASVDIRQWSRYLYYKECPSVLSLILVVLNKKDLTDARSLLLFLIYQRSTALNCPQTFVRMFIRSHKEFRHLLRIYEYAIRNDTDQFIKNVGSNPKLRSFFLKCMEEEVFNDEIPLSLVPKIVKAEKSFRIGNLEKQKYNPQQFCKELFAFTSMSGRMLRLVKNRNYKIYAEYSVLREYLISFMGVDHSNAAYQYVEMMRYIRSTNNDCPSPTITPLISSCNDLAKIEISPETRTMIIPLFVNHHLYTIFIDVDIKNSFQLWFKNPCQATLNLKEQVFQELGKRIPKFCIFNIKHYYFSFPGLSGRFSAQDFCKYQFFHSCEFIIETMRSLYDTQYRAPSTNSSPNVPNNNRQIVESLKTIEKNIQVNPNCSAQFINAIESMLKLSQEEEASLSGANSVLRKVKQVFEEGHSESKKKIIQFMSVPQPFLERRYEEIKEIFISILENTFSTRFLIGTASLHSFLARFFDQGTIVDRVQLVLKKEEITNKVKDLKIDSELWENFYSIFFTLKEINVIKELLQCLNQNANISPRPSKSTFESKQSPRSGSIKHTMPITPSGWPYGDIYRRTNIDDLMIALLEENNQKHMLSLASYAIGTEWKYVNLLFEILPLKIQQSDFIEMHTAVLERTISSFCENNPSAKEVYELMINGNCFHPMYL